MTVIESCTGARLIFDPGFDAPPDAAGRLNAGYSWSDVVEDLLLCLMGSDAEPQVFAGRRVLRDLARSSGRPVRTRHGRPSLTMYSLVGIITVLEDSEIGLDSVRFGRPLFGLGVPPTPLRPRVLLDCDGVLSDFVGGLLPIIAEVAQREVLLEAWTAWDFASSFGLTAEQKKEVGDRLVAQPGFCDGLSVCAGAVDGVRLLAEVAEIYVVTSPWDSCPTWEYERKAWLWRHLQIPKRNVIQGAAKHMIGGEILVEDKTSTLHAWAAAHPDGEPIRWVTPHNRAEPWGGLETCDWGVIRCRAEAAYLRLRGEESAL